MARLPVPGPATMELLKGLPTFGVDLDGETVTPTGAALLKALGKSFGDQPAMTIDKIGYGTGQKEFSNRPNLFRLIHRRQCGPSGSRKQMLVIETNIDDMNPQHFDHVMERLFAAGARDVFLAPIQMKKNRPATLLTVICELAQRDRLAAVILQETSTIGVRYYPVSRILLEREAKKVKTRFGEVTVKIVTQPDGSKRATPEYDDLKRIATAKRTTLKTIHDEVMRQLNSQHCFSANSPFTQGSRGRAKSDPGVVKTPKRAASKSISTFGNLALWLRKYHQALPDGYLLRGRIHCLHDGGIAARSATPIFTEESKKESTSCLRITPRNRRTGCRPGPRCVCATTVCFFCSLCARPPRSRCARRRTSTKSMRFPDRRFNWA